MKNIYLLCTIVFSSFTVHAQVDKSADELENSIVSLDLLAPGVTVEKKVGYYSSINFGANVGFTFYYYENSNGQSGSSFLAIPVFLSQYRYYYNFEKRKDKAKKTWYNSANYFGFNVSYQISPIAGDVEDFIYEPGALIGPFWGVQRNGLITFNLYLGYGYYTGTSEPSTFGNIKLGLNLTKLTSN